MITYRIDATDTASHEFIVEMRVPKPSSEQEFALPVWIPGSYMVRDFARHLHSLQAEQDGQPVALTALDKTRWRAHCHGRGALTLRYRAYAFDTSVRTAFLNSQRGFFNGTSLCLQALGQPEQTHRLELKKLPPEWRVATSLTPVKVNAQGLGSYEALDYDELIDHPVELGTFWRGSFTAHGVPHEIVVAGALPDFDGERLLTDTQKICEAQIAFWHQNKVPPFARYVFLINAVDEGYGGLEHRASTALLVSRRDLPAVAATPATEPSDAYVTLLGLISHEYFHTWNVKRLRPTEFAKLDLSREQHTELLWFFEGFTSYFDDLFLVRTQLISEARYVKLLGKTIAGVLATPGRALHSVAQASFDAWVKYYRQDENSPNTSVSYYTKGSLVALSLDALLRGKTGGTLDDVMRALWLRSGGGPIHEADIAQALSDVAGKPMAATLHAFVHGTDDLPLAALLKPLGLELKAQAPTTAQALGVRASESQGVKVTHVLHGGPAHAAGVSAGDELIALQGWRLRRLDDVPCLMPTKGSAELIVARDQRLITLRLAAPLPKATEGAVQLSLSANAGKAATTAAKLRAQWLQTGTA